MKIKLLVVKYVDWVILAILAIGCLVVLYQAFVRGDTNVNDLRKEMEQAEATVKKHLSRTDAPALGKPDLVKEMRDRFEHPSVIPPFRRNPFLSFEDILYPTPLQVDFGQTLQVPLQNVHLTDIVSTDRRVETSISYNAESAQSLVVFKGLLVGGPAEIRIQDDTERAWKFNVTVSHVTKRPPPNGPIAVQCQARAPVEREGFRFPAAVLISFMPDQPLPGAALTVGLTSAARIYRKPADGSDREYVQIGPNLIQPPGQPEVETILKRFQADVSVLGVPAASGAPAPAGPVVPEAAPTIGGSVTSVPAVSPFLQGAYVWLDETVDEGESYAYKIVTYNVPQTGEPVPTEKPFVYTPLAVPALVEFRVASVFPDGSSAKFTLTRTDPETGLPLEQSVTVAPGMPIGGLMRVGIRTVGVDGRVRTEYKNVDFSTNCILVEALPAYPDIQYTIRAERRTGKNTYSASVKRTPHVLYLTPRGFLRTKAKEGR